MNRDRVKGTIDEAAGLAKRKEGELMGSTGLELEGMVQQVKGKVESAWGQAKDAVRDVNEKASASNEPHV